MGRFKWAWGRVRSGQVIWFRYGKTGRTIIVLSCPKDPGTKDRQKLHGIEITRGRRGKNWIRSRLPLICRFTGGVQLLIDEKNGGKYYRVQVQVSPFMFVGFDSASDKSINKIETVAKKCIEDNNDLINDICRKLILAYANRKID